MTDDNVLFRQCVTHETMLYLEIAKQGLKNVPELMLDDDKNLGFLDAPTSKYSDVAIAVGRPAAMR